MKRSPILAGMIAAFAALSSAQDSGSDRPYFAFTNNLTKVAVVLPWNNTVRLHERENDVAFDDLDDLDDYKEVQKLNVAFDDLDDLDYYKEVQRLNVTFDDNLDDYGVAFSGDGNFFAVETAGHDVNVYPTTSNLEALTVKSINGESNVRAVAMNGDGTMIIVGSNNHSFGEMHIYTKDSYNKFTLVKEIIGHKSDGYLGTAVSMSTSGERVLGYADNARPDDDINHTELPSGAISVYDKQNGTWDKLGSDIMGNEGDGYDGFASLSGDGNTVLQGYLSDDKKHWRAVLYKYQGNDWMNSTDITLCEDISNSDKLDERIRPVVKLSEDGNTIYIAQWSRSNTSFQFTQVTTKDDSGSGTQSSGTRVSTSVAHIVVATCAALFISLIPFV